MPIFEIGFLLLLDGFGYVIDSKKLLVHGLGAKLMVELRSNRIKPRSKRSSIDGLTGRTIGWLDPNFKILVCDDLFIR